MGEPICSVIVEDEARIAKGMLDLGRPGILGDEAVCGRDCASAEERR